MRLAWSSAIAATCGKAAREVLDEMAGVTGVTGEKGFLRAAATVRPNCAIWGKVSGLSSPGRSRPAVHYSGSAILGRARRFCRKVSEKMSWKFPYQNTVNTCDPCFMSMIHAFFLKKI